VSKVSTFSLVLVVFIVFSVSCAGNEKAARRAACLRTSLSTCANE